MMSCICITDEKDGKRKIGIDSVTVPKNGAIVVGGGSGHEMWKCLAL
jgi:hypothetical protein